MQSIAIRRLLRTPITMNIVALGPFHFVHSKYVHLGARSALLDKTELAQFAEIHVSNEVNIYSRFTPKRLAEVVSEFECLLCY